ncbi:disease resistance protein TAO1-like isoform X2 [Capsella rubella]|uniref:disease resistance protein TAO1-like isoform X2 n=1 Tax=Capsella rubella TaxID=81985 RepID=UPI000CD4D156|nr:disease resistance protein TAO1-like isoform X2 [Capsella rubella]
MDSSFLLTTLAAAVCFFTFLVSLFFMVYRKFRFYQENKDLDDSSSSSSSSSPSSSLSSSSLPSSFNWTTHHVFPSFRGEDVRRNFLSHIQKEFQRRGITPFIDNDIKRGESIGPELIRAIRGSKIAIVLLSRNYASSKWCIEELAEIMKCKRELGQTVFAIFYEVDPSHVKNLTGEFGAVFEKTCAGRTKEDIGRWRKAFAEVATIAGYDSRNWDNEAVIIEEIVTEISKRLINSIPSNDFEGLIGMEARMEKAKQLLCLGSDERMTIGIWGPSGIGKTTIARILYNQISHGFQLSVFMKLKPIYSRTTCSDDHDVKLHLEQQLLSQLTNQEDIKFRHLGTAQRLLMGKRVLIVLDGVNQSVQLRAMPKAQFLGPGSRIIITTQDQKLLKTFGVKHIYDVDYPPHNEALQIFCMNAFGQDSPYNGFEKLSMEVTILVGRLPLGLRVMGSHLQGMCKKEWEVELPRLRIRLDGEIGSILKLSYDALDEEDKYLFLQIACFFNDEGITEIIEGTLGNIFSDVRQGHRVLLQRSLISNQIMYPMHNLLVQLGRDIVRNQSIYEPGKRQFLVDAMEISEVLTDDTGSESVIGINLDFCEIKDKLDISKRAFEKMSNLQFLRFRNYGDSWKNVHLPQDLNYLPPKIRILRWDNYPLSCLPSKFTTKFLVKIKMYDSKLEKLWEGNQLLRNLRVMNLYGSSNLKELPDLSTATNLQELNLYGCSSLVELPSSIGNLINLEKLILIECSTLVMLPSSIGNLHNLQKLDASECSNLVDLPSSMGNLINLQSLDLSECISLKLNLVLCLSLVELPSSIGNITNLQQLYLAGCSSLVELPSSIGNIISLEELYLSGCSNLVNLPCSIGNLTNLQILNLKGCSKLVELPSSIGNITNLLKLNLNGCSSLVEIPSSFGNLRMLTKFSLEGCSKLEVLPTNINLVSSC